MVNPLFEAMRAGQGLDMLDDMFQQMVMPGVWAVYSSIDLQEP